MLRCLNALRRRPVQGIREVAKTAGLSYPAAGKAVADLEAMGIVRELTGKRRNRIYAYDRYLAALNQGTEVA